MTDEEYKNFLILMPKFDQNTTDVNNTQLNNDHNSDYLTNFSAVAKYLKID
jgi:hypothetical protein